MTNHLRIALKHLLDEQNVEHEMESGNYRVSRDNSKDNRVIAIDHLMFNGEGGFQTCQWDLRKRMVYICKGKNCPPSEIIFVLRTIKKLGYAIDHVIYGLMEDDSREVNVSPMFEKYLSN